MGTVGIVSKTTRGIYGDRWKPFHAQIKMFVEQDLIGSNQTEKRCELSDSDENSQIYLKEDWNVLKYQEGI